MNHLCHHCEITLSYQKQLCFKSQSQHLPHIHPSTHHSSPLPKKCCDKDTSVHVGVVEGNHHHLDISFFRIPRKLHDNSAKGRLAAVSGLLSLPSDNTYRLHFIYPTTRILHCSPRRPLTLLPKSCVLRLKLWQLMSSSFSRFGQKPLAVKVCQEVITTQQWNWGEIQIQYDVARE